MKKNLAKKAERSEDLSAFTEYCGVQVFRDRAERLVQTINKGQEILLWGYIGAAGTCYLQEYCREELAARLPGHFIRSASFLKDQASCWPDLDMLSREGLVTAAFPVEEGGLLAALGQLAGCSQYGFVIDYESVPVHQATVEFCEIFDLNPWQIYGGGCALLIADHGFTVAARLKAAAGMASAGNIPCKVIGYISDDQDKLICHDDVRSCLNRPQPDDILKVLKAEHRIRPQEHLTATD